MGYVRDEETSKDIVHDVFITVWNNRNTIDFSRPMYPYLLSLTRNRCFNHLEHEKVQGRHKNYELTFSELYDTANTNDHEELVARIVSRIDQLPEKCSVVMRLCFLECKTYKEIADELDISVNTVKAHLSSGLKILRHEFPGSLLLVLLFRVAKKMQLT